MWIFYTSSSARDPRVHNIVGRGDGEREENVMLATPDFHVIDWEEEAYGFSDIS